MTAEIGRTANKHLSSECGKAMSLSSSRGDMDFDSSWVIVETEQQLQQSRQLPPPPPQQQLQQQQQLPQEVRTLSAKVQIWKTLGKTIDTVKTKQVARNLARRARERKKHLILSFLSNRRKWGKH